MLDYFFHVRTNTPPPLWTPQQNIETGEFNFKRVIKGRRGDVDDYEW